MSSPGGSCEHKNLPANFECTNDASTCLCVGCTNDGQCTAADDCVCGACSTDAFCSNASNCQNDGVCSPFNESCLCADCANHPECQ